jgi:sugar lactone lactonase YvrE
VGGGTSLTVTGVGFTEKTQLFVGGLPCSNVSSAGSGSLTGSTPAGAATGAVTITVRNDDGQRDHLPNGFTYTSSAVNPTVTSVTPSTGPAGTLVQILGSGFQSGATITFGSASVTSSSFISATQYNATVPPGTGTVAVTITNPDTGTGNLPNGFTFSGTPPITGTGGKAISTFAGTGTAGTSGVPGPATAAQLSGPQGVALASDGSVFIADTANNRILKVDSSGNATPVPAPGLNGPRGVATDTSGNIYIADSGNNVVRKLSGGTMTTIAGTVGSPGNSGDGSPATGALLTTPVGVAVDHSGDVIIVDTANHRVRVIDTGGNIQAFAGTGTTGFTSDTATVATQSQLASPTGVAIDATGNVYIADGGNSRVRIVSKSNGMMATFAGGGSASPVGGGQATLAQLSLPVGVAVDATSSVVIADQALNEVFIVSPSGTITLLAGSGTGGDGPATSAALKQPEGLAAGTSVYYIAETGNNKIRKVQ